MSYIIRRTESSLNGVSVYDISICKLIGSDTYAALVEIFPLLWTKLSSLPSSHEARNLVRLLIVSNGISGIELKKALVYRVIYGPSSTTSSAISTLVNSSPFSNEYETNNGLIVASITVLVLLVTTITFYK